MAPDTLAHIDALIHRPHGIFLVTGPTGSGKTTTLYAALSRLKAGELNIMTVEDPVEYDLPDIGQTQVNARIDLTFAKALRSILRQDPDVIMIGEIRDLETAQIAVQASLTDIWYSRPCIPTTVQRRDAAGRHGRGTAARSSLVGVLARVCAQAVQRLPATVRAGCG
jgi:general secretion pathway protein E